MILGKIWRNARSPASLLSIAREQFDSGNYSECAELCVELIRSNPDNASAHDLLGHASWKTSGAASAIPHLEQAIRVEPARSATWLSLAEAQQIADSRSAALATLRRRCDTTPTDVDAWLALSDIIVVADTTKEAEEVLERCVAIAGDDARVHTRLGLLRARRADWTNASVAFEAAHEIEPESLSIAMHFAFALEMNAQLTYASQILETAIGFGNETADLFLQGARVSRRLGNATRAVALGQQAVLLNDENAEVHYQLGCSLWAEGEIAGAGASFQAAFQRDPEHSCARWAFAMCALPALPVEHPDEIARLFSARLEFLENWLSEERARTAIGALGAFTPFFLAYIERDNAPLLSRYGDLCARIMRAQPKIVRSAEARSRSRDDKIRVGIVSAHLFNHSVWQAMVRGWVCHLNKSTFAIYAYALKKVADGETEIAKENCEKFVQLEGRDYRAWADVILEDNLDVLIYPEIGMHGVTVQLACNRLAPVQVIAWGHPESSGLPEIDYFLSGEDFEPEGANAFYREKLVPLRHLGVHFESPFGQSKAVALSDEELVDLGIAANRPILLSAGSAFKYPAARDHLFVQIAMRVPDAQIVFFDDGRGRLGAQLHDRLAQAFSRAGLEYRRHVVVVNWLAPNQWRSLLARATALLDTPGFSGFNTAAQALAADVPVVAWDGQFLRGRLASGLLRRMSMMEWITTDAEGYVERVACLCEDPRQRKAVVDQISANKRRAFDDFEPIYDMERFIASCLGR